MVCLTTNFPDDKMIKTTVLDGDTFLVPRLDMLFCLCHRCLNEINWRHLDSSYELTGECCGMAHRARPANPRIGAYRITSKEVQGGNIQMFPKPWPQAPGSGPKVG